MSTNELVAVSQDLIRSLQPYSGRGPIAKRIVTDFVDRWHHTYDMASLRRALEAAKLQAEVRTEIIGLLEQEYQLQDVQHRLRHQQARQQREIEREESDHRAHLAENDRIIHGEQRRKRKYDMKPVQKRYRGLVNVRNRVLLLQQVRGERDSELGRLRREGWSESELGTVRQMYEQLIDDISTGDL